MALQPESSADEALSEAHVRIAQSEERWRSVFENSAIGVALADLNGRFIAANPVFRNMLGYTQEELGQFSFIDITVEEDRKRNGVLVEELLTGKRKQFQIEKRYRRKNGSIVWARTSVSIVPGTERVPQFLMALSEDVTYRKRAEEALKASERELSSIINTIPTLAWSAEADGSVTFLNQRWLDYTDLSTEDARDRGWRVAIHPDDLEGLVEYWKSRLAAGEPGDVETRLRRNDGAYRWFLVRFEPFRGETGEILRWYSTATDIEDRKRAEEELKANESRFRDTIDTIPTMAWSCRPDGYCDFVNRRWLETTGLSGEEPLGWGWGASIHPDDLKSLAEYWQACLASGATADAEARMRLFDGTYRWFLFRASPLRDKSGRIVKWYGTNTDIDDRKRAEEALRASELTLRETVDNIPGLGAKTNPMGELEFLNRRTLEYFGKSMEEMETWAVDGTIHPDDVRGVIEARKKSIEEWKPYEYEVRCRRADGTYRWFQIRGGLPLRDAKGALTSRYLLLIDIEERKQAEDRLRRNEDVLAKGQRLNLTGSFSWCIDTNEVVFSDEAYRIFEFEPSTPITHELIASRIHPEDFRLYASRKEGAQGPGGSQDYEIRLRMPSGSIKYLRTMSSDTRDAHGRREQIGAIQDLTQRRHIEDALDKARSELAHVAR